MSFSHFLITRFNITTGFSSGLELDDDWLCQRCLLFEKFCVPSVLNQRNSNFKWLILMNEFTGQKWIEKVKEILSVGIINHEIILVSNTYEEQIRKYLLLQKEGVDFLITSRLDNDDAIHKDFVDLVQSKFAKQLYTFIEFTNGYTFSVAEKLLFKRHFKGNPFVSLIEKFSSSLTTVYSGNHLYLYERGEFIRFEEPFGWIQVIHGGNVWNKLKGVRVNGKTILSKGVYGTGFKMSI